MRSLHKHVKNNLRPWGDFFFPLRAPESIAEAIQSARENFAFLQVNYAVAFLCYLGFQIVTSAASM